MTTIGKPLIALALLAALLAACTTTMPNSSDDRLGRMLVAPGKYVLYNCPDIARAATAVALRQRELERLMAKASVDAGGRFVSSLAYKPEYLEKGGEMNELRDAAIAKNCKVVPGNDAPGGRASDSAVR